MTRSMGQWPFASWLRAHNIITSIIFSCAKRLVSPANHTKKCHPQLPKTLAHKWTSLSTKGILHPAKLFKSLTGFSCKNPSWGGLLETQPLWPVTMYILVRLEYIHTFRKHIPCEDIYPDLWHWCLLIWCSKTDPLNAEFHKYCKGKSFVVIFIACVQL